MSATAGGSPTPIPRSPARRGLIDWRAVRRQLAVFGLFMLIVGVVWEALKFLGGVPWRTADNQVFHNPPLRIAFVDDLNLPHVWNIVGAMAAPFQRGGSVTLLEYLMGEAAYTWSEAAIGFGVGALLGMALAISFVHSGLLERAFVPYVVASQTIPIVALAPMIVFAFGQNLISVVIIATYLTFFPVTIAGIRGLRAPDPRALELMRSYAASRRTVLWKLRLPASLPYVFTALKISATASIVGAIIGESAGGVPRGLGSAIQTFNQQYITGPEKLWVAIIVSGVVGVASYLIVRTAEIYVLRARPDAAAG